MVEQHTIPDEDILYDPETAPKWAKILKVKSDSF